MSGQLMTSLYYTTSQSPSGGDDPPSRNDSSQRPDISLSETNSPYSVKTHKRKAEDEIAEAAAAAAASVPTSDHHHQRQQEQQEQGRHQEEEEQQQHRHHFLDLQQHESHEHTPDQQASHPDIPSHQQRPKRNRYVTIACNECKRRKIKCNGQQPCLRCGNLSLQCIYTPNCCGFPFRESEEFRTMNAQIQSLQQQIDNLYAHISALRHDQQSMTGQIITETEETEETTEPAAHYQAEQAGNAAEASGGSPDVL